MLSSKNTREQLKRQQVSKQRFAIRKLTVGVASVLIGFTFLGINGMTVANADSSTPTSDSSTTTPAVATNNSSTSTDSAAPAGSNTAVSVTPIAGTPNTSTSPITDGDSSMDSSTGADQSIANAITADAIADGYIKSTTDATNAKNTLSGRAWVVTTGTPATMSNGLRPLPDGTKVYLKWMDTDGSVSPTYVASIKALGTSDGSQVGPGAYAFDLRDGWTDANGKLHKYSAVAGQYYKLWIPDFQAADGNTITMMRQVSGYYPGSWVNSVTSKNLGQFPLIGTNMQRTGVFMYEIPAGAFDGGASYMTTAKDKWVEDPAGPLSAPAVSGDKDSSGTISGRVWLETAGDIVNSATGPNYNSLMGDTAAKDYTVIASMLTPEGVKAYKEQIEELSVSEQPAAAKELLTIHPEYIATTVYGKANENGQYTLRFPKDITWENTYVYMTVLDSKDQLATTYSAYTMPVFRSPNANNSWLPQTSPAYNAIATGSPSWYNVNFAIVNNTMVTLDITNFNSTDKPAYYGDTAKIKLDAKGAEISPLSNYIQWTDTKGNKVGDPVPVTLLSDGNKANLTIVEDGKTVTINGISYELKNQVKTGDVFTATLYEGNDSNPVAKDSFVVKAQDKDLYEPTYEKKTVSAGQKATVTPTFTNSDGETVTMPEGTTFTVDSSSSAAAAGWSTLDSATGEITYHPAVTQAAGDYYIPVTVTYPDGTSEVVNPQVTVSNEAGEYTATGGEVTKPYGEATTANDVIDKVTTDYPTTGDQPTITVADPSTLPDGKTAGTYEVPVTVTYPDGTADKATVTVTVLDKIIDQTKNPDAPTPEGYVRVTFEAGDHGSFADSTSTIFDVREGTAFSDLPLPTVVANSGYQQKSGTDAWSPALPTIVDAAGTYTAQYEESAPDADKYTPTGQDLTTEQGQEPNASDGIANKDDLPAGTEYTWKDTPDVSTPGTKQGTIIVTYPDGSKDEVTVNVTVTVPTPTETDADKYQATGGKLTKPYGEATTANDVIGKVTTDYPTTGDQPTITVDDLSVLPNGTKPGTYEIPVTVTYPDGSKDQTTVTVTVLDKIIDQTKNPDAPTPEGYVRVTFEAGDHGSFADSTSTIFDVREGTAFSELLLPTVLADNGYQQKSGTDAWSPALPTTVDATATYTVQYEESSQPTDADKYTPTVQDLTTEQGQEPSASDGISNKDDLPTGTEYTWKEVPDASTPGTKPGTIVVTYPDGSKDEVTVNVTVTAPTPTETDADTNTPEPQPIDTPKGVVPNPGDGVANKGDLPDGTNYTWADPDKVNQDVNTPGTYDETVIVTYPDGSQDVIVVRVTVTEPADSSKQVVGNNSNGKPASGEAALNNKAKVNTLPQTGNNNSAAVAGLGLVSLATMFGLGWLKKKN